MHHFAVALVTTPERGREAAAYFQQFIRSHRAEYAELMQGVNPNQGYGRGNNALMAHRIAMMFYHYIDERFVNCFIPENYGSPDHFRVEIKLFDSMLDAAEQELRTAINNQATDSVVETMPMVLEQVVACRYAISETLAQLGSPEPPPQRGQTNTFEILEMIAVRFPMMVERLKVRRAEQPPLAIANEYDVQYLFQSVLALYFDDIRPEESVPSIAGGAGRVDTLLPAEETIVEFKMTRDGSKDIHLRRELADDFVLYAKHPQGKQLFVFVYDPRKHIQNPAGFAKDLSEPRPPLHRVRTFVQQG
jgi:hypothetical protein